MEYTMEQHDNSMTIFYYKRTGEIYMNCTGIQDLGAFGIYEEDYKHVFDYVVLEKDMFALDNIKLFKIDLDTKELVYNANKLQKYAIR